MYGTTEPPQKTGVQAPGITRSTSPRAPVADGNTSECAATRRATLARRATHLLLREHAHPAEHVVGKVDGDGADDEIRAPLAEVNDLDSILTHGQRAHAQKETILGIIDEADGRRCAWNRNERRRIDVVRLGTGRIDGDLMEAGNDEVDRSSGLDGCRPWATAGECSARLERSVVPSGREGCRRSPATRQSSRSRWPVVR